MRGELGKATRVLLDLGTSNSFWVTGSSRKQFIRKTVKLFVLEKVREALRHVTNERSWVRKNSLKHLNRRSREKSFKAWLGDRRR